MDVVSTTIDSANQSERLREEIEAVAGVSSAIMAPGGDPLYLIIDPNVESGPIEPEVRQILMRAGIDPDAITIEFLVRQRGGLRQRVRFRGVDRFPVEPGMVRIEVRLEWQDESYVGKVTGEAGPVIELRTAASAAIEAVIAILGGEIGLRLTGIKEVRAFDTSLVITSIHYQGPPHRHFVGTTIVGDDPLRSASVSVLHALNRMLGNFLATSD